jgi:hypothetical protein
MSRAPLSAIWTFSLSIACVVFGMLAIPSSTGAQEYIGWAVGDVDVHPPQPRLDCPAGSFIRSISVTEDEWLARIAIYCVTSAQLTSTDPRTSIYPGTPGLDAGGDGGSGAHTAMLTCSNGVVDGLTGLRTQVWPATIVPKAFYAADPRLFCGTYSSPGASVIRDTQFQRSGDNAVSYLEMNSIYPDPGIQARFRCPARWGATGIWYKLGNAKKDDIQAFGLICGALPAPARVMLRRRP